MSKETNEYLDQIELERQRKIDEEQRRWYEMRLKMMGDAMKQEFPSNAREAFESANEGLYYGAQISKLRAAGAITKVPMIIRSPFTALLTLALTISRRYGVFKCSEEGQYISSTFMRIGMKRLHITQIGLINRNINMEGSYCLTMLLNARTPTNFHMRIISVLCWMVMVKSLFLKDVTATPLTEFKQFDQCWVAVHSIKKNVAKE